MQHPCAKPLTVSLRSVEDGIAIKWASRPAWSSASLGYTALLALKKPLLAGQNRRSAQDIENYGFPRKFGKSSRAQPIPRMSTELSKD